MLSTKDLIAKILEALAEILAADLVVESGVDANNFHYKKYASGRLEAERVWNIGGYTINTIEASPIRVGGTVNVVSPVDMISGTVDVTLVGNSSNSPCFIERISPSQFRIAKAIGSTVSLSNMTVCLRTAEAYWK